MHSLTKTYKGVGPYCVQISFTSERSDENGLVIDARKLDVVWDVFEDCFPVSSLETFSESVFDNAMALLSKHFPDDVSDRKLAVVSVTCWEDSDVSVTYREDI